VVVLTRMAGEAKRRCTVRARALSLDAATTQVGRPAITSLANEGPAEREAAQD
jgi:hypothetical protein